MSDVLLVNGMDFLYSKTPSPYIGHYILEKVLRENGISVSQLNVDAERTSGRLRLPEDPDSVFNMLADRILSVSPRIVGFYTICSSFITTVQVAMKLHVKAPEVMIIFGGPHATITAEACLRDLGFLTAVCLGESEYSILPLVRALLDGIPLNGLAGIAWRKDGQIMKSPCCDLVPAERLTDYSISDYGPDYHGIDFSYTIEGGRGCPFHCTFCSTSTFWQRTFRIKPVDILIGEMDRCHREQGTSVFAIEHDMFTVNRQYITDFCNRLIEKGTPYRWRCSSRVDVLDEELASLMTKAGCIHIFLGIETGSPRMQKLIHKNLDLENAARITKYLKKCGLSVSASFIQGFPEETEEDFLQTVSLMEDLMIAGIDNLQLHPFMLLPGTEETTKVYGRAVFNERDIDMSIYNRSMINEESRELIRKHREIFIQYYSFESEVRSKYPWFSTVFALASLRWNAHRNTFITLARKPGLREIYLKYADLFRDFYFRFDEHLYSECAMPIVRSILEQIVTGENDKALTEIFRYECDLLEYGYSDSQDSIIRSYRLNVDKVTQLCEYTPEEKKYLFRKGENNRVKAARIPDWITVK